MEGFSPSVGSLQVLSGWNCHLDLSSEAQESGEVTAAEQSPLLVTTTVTIPGPCTEGAAVGKFVAAEGASVDNATGASVSARVGTAVSTAVGASVGRSVATALGAREGTAVSTLTGEPVGDKDTTALTSPTQISASKPPSLLPQPARESVDVEVGVPLQSEAPLKTLTLMVRSVDEQETTMEGAVPSVGTMQAFIGWKDHMEESNEDQDARGTMDAEQASLVGVTTVTIPAPRPAKGLAVSTGATQLMPEEALEGPWMQPVGRLNEPVGVPVHDESMGKVVTTTWSLCGSHWRSTALLSAITHLLRVWPTMTLVRLGTEHEPSVKERVCRKL